MILNIFVAVLVVFVVLILLACISVDVMQTKKYKNSLTVKGTICEEQGKELVKYYGRYGIRPYGKYLVDVRINEKDWKKTVLLKQSKLKVGETVTVHYAIENGEPEMLNDISYRRLRELIIAFFIAIPFCAALIYSKSHGII